MAYVRFFMPLLAETKGYGFKGREPSGRSIAEWHNNKGKISVWVQDLKPEENYDVYIVFPSERQHIGIAMGKLTVDAGGRGELRRDMGVKEFGSFDLSDFMAVAVVAAGKAEVVSPLCGYKKNSVPWRHGFAVWREDDKQEDEKEDKKEEKVEPLRDTTPVATPPPPTPPMATRPAAVVSETNISDTENEQDAERPLLQTDTILLIETIFNANTPFAANLQLPQEVKWVRCTDHSQMPVPSGHPHIMSEPFMLNAWADHEHFILGITDSGELPQYIIGIAGVYSPETEAIAKGLGFDQFGCRKKEHPDIGDDGYWLMFVTF